MGLQFSTVMDTGISLAQAYVRVNQIMYFYADKRVNINVSIYQDKATRDGAFRPIITKDYYIDNVNGGFDLYFGASVLSQTDCNPIKQAYEYLKTLPEFNGATDL